MATRQPAPTPAPRRTPSPPARPARPATPAGPPPKPLVIKPFWAEFKEPTPGKARTEIEQPDEWKGDDVIVGGEFHPTPIWDKPGATVEGIYRGLSEHRGPNDQNMWHFQNDDGGFFDVWGATTLDTRLMEMLNAGQLATGYRVRITFKGDESTKRGQNPAHTFDVRVKAQ